jgi:hypothetical protein
MASIPACARREIAAGRVRQTLDDDGEPVTIH